MFSVSRIVGDPDSATKVTEQGIECCSFLAAETGQLWLQPVHQSFASLVAEKAQILVLSTREHDLSTLPDVLADAVPVQNAGGVSEVFVVNAPAPFSAV